MPVDLQNPKLFKPHIPTSMGRHFLFGTKFFKTHQFRDGKWPPHSITHQYNLMANCLKKNLQYKKLKLAAESKKQLRSVHRLKQECFDGRVRLKNAHLGDLTTIRRILIKRKDLERKYKSMPLDAIMENCDQETFLRRKENDRLKFQLRSSSNRLQNVLLEQAKLEDRIKYSNEFILQTELDAKVYRKDIKNSQTRIEAYKLVRRAYQKILESLSRDDMFLESVLDALKGDVVEQQNFIHQIVLLGIPAKRKNDQLSEEFKLMEDNARAKMKENALFIANARKELLNLQKETKTLVRNYNPSKPPKYLRTTPSMEILQSDIEELETIINEIRLVTMSPDAENIEITMLTLVKNIDYFDKKNNLDFIYKGILINKYGHSVAQESLLKHNFSHSESERLQTIEDFKQQVQYQSKMRMQCDAEIVNTGNMLQTLNFSLWNVVDVLRHLGKKPDPVHKEYPNVDLKLPLLKFDFFNIQAIPPLEYDRSSKKLVQLAKDKILILMRNQFYKAVITDQEINRNRKAYHFDYIRTLEEEEGMGARMVDGGGEPLFATTTTDGNILTRVIIKDMSAKIVEKNAKKETDI